MKFSIITASYNYANFIDKTIESVLAQTFQDWELIIVDDASSDDSVEVIKRYNDPRIKLIVNKKNKGLIQTLKVGLNAASGEWIAFLESDDMFAPNNLEKRNETIEKYPDVSLIFNDVEFFGDEDLINYRKKWLECLWKIRQSYSYPANIFDGFFHHNIIVTFSSVCMKKEALKQEYFNSPSDRLFDWWLYIHVAKNNLSYFLDEKITKWRIHGESYISKHKGFEGLINIRAYLDVAKHVKSFSDLLFSLKVTRLMISKIDLRLLYVASIRAIKKRLNLPLK